MYNGSEETVNCSGLGYIVGSTVAAIADEWQWGVRVTPIAGITTSHDYEIVTSLAEIGDLKEISHVAGIFCVILIILFVQEVPRGRMEVSILKN